MFNLTPATQEEHDSLVEKCQKNGWLKRGGFDWQDDPWLEEYPYEFSRASTIKDLADFFSNGNWCVWQSNSRQFGMQEFDTLTANMPTITNGYSCLASVTTRKAGKAYDQHVQSTFY